MAEATIKRREKLKAKNKEQEGCHIKMAAHPEKLKTDMVHRLNRLEGQMRGLARMISDDVYCDDVLHQLLSAEAALAGVKRTLLEAHIKGCVVSQIRKGDDNVVDELMITLGKIIKR